MGRFGIARLAGLAVLACAGAMSTGCGPSFGPQARYGIVFYCPGAGNIDFGDVGIREGLEAAGFRGQVATVNWTVSLNPIIDHVARINARFGGTRLARMIEEYQDRYPNAPVNIVGLSAGTGVAIWALEDLKPGYKVDNVVLLASSLSSSYDKLDQVLPHLRGRIYNVYSPKDPVLSGPMKVAGTIDGVFFESGAGEVGLHPRRGAERVTNIRWRPEFERYGYYGGHTDGTRAAFVQAVISPYLLGAGGHGPTASGAEADDAARVSMRHSN